MRYLEGFQNLAKQESAQVQDTEEGFWFGSGPKAGAVPGSEITCIGVSVEVAESADLLCFDTLGGGQYRSLYQKVVVEKTCELGLIEIALLLPPAQIGDRWEWAQVSIYDDDGVGGLPLTLLGRCVPVPLQTLTDLNITTLILPVWVPFAVTAGDVIWVAISGKAYNDPPYAWNYSTNTHCLALGDRTTVGTDLIKAEDEEPPFTTAPPVDIPDVHVWVRIYSDPLSADYPVTDTATLSVHPAGARAIVARPVRGQVESSYVQGIRPRYASVPYSQTIYGAGVGGGGGLTVPAGPDGAVQYNDGGAFGGEAHFIWDDANDYLGLFGLGSGGAAPAYPLHIQRSSVGSDRTLAYFRNTSPATDALAQTVLQGDNLNAWLALIMHSSAYEPTPGFTYFANKGMVYTSAGADGLALLPISGAIEFWLYGNGYPADSWTHVADVTSDAAAAGIFPAADSTFVLGSEIGPKRWADGSFDQLHVNSYLLSMAGALTVEAASAINQDLTSDSAVAQFTKVGLGAAAGNPRLLIKQVSGDDFLTGIHLTRAGAANTWAAVVGGDNRLYIGYAANPSLAANFTKYLTLDTDGTLAIPTGRFIGEYQTQSGAWADPTGTGVNGRIVTVYNSTAAASRLYCYSNAVWRYTALT